MLPAKRKSDTNSKDDIDQVIDYTFKKPKTQISYQESDIQTLNIHIEPFTYTLKPNGHSCGFYDIIYDKTYCQTFKDLVILFDISKIQHGSLSHINPTIIDEVKNNLKILNDQYESLRSRIHKFDDDKINIMEYKIKLEQRTKTAYDSGSLFNNTYLSFQLKDRFATYCKWISDLIMVHQHLILEKKQYNILKKKVQLQLDVVSPLFGNIGLYNVNRTFEESQTVLNDIVLDLEQKLLKSAMRIFFLRIEVNKAKKQIADLKTDNTNLTSLLNKEENITK